MFAPVYSRSFENPLSPVVLDPRALRHRQPWHCEYGRERARVEDRVNVRVNFWVNFRLKVRMKVRVRPGTKCKLHVGTSM